MRGSRLTAVILCGLVGTLGGALTLVVGQASVVTGVLLDWSSAQGAALFGSLVGHIVYGVLVGLVYAAVDRLWVGFFTESDPINRAPEGPGLRVCYLLQWGAVASLAGGLLFSLVMVATGVLPRVASLVGGSSPVLGFLVHMGISALVGMSYGVLFQHEAGRGRDAGYSAPPAQIPACGTTAPGSGLGS